MKKYFSLFITIILLSNTLSAQTVYEVGIKPFEYTKLNFETNVGLGKGKSMYGIILSYRPDTRDYSDADKPTVKNNSTVETTYGVNNYANHLLASYTAGVYYKYYFTPNHHFVEADLLYRNWNFNKKHAYLDQDDYSESYSYDGVRSENINVYALKILIGKTFIFNDADKKNAFCLDLLGGVGLRYKTNVYETYNGTVNGTYYTYLKETGEQWMPSFHLTVRCSISNMNR